MISAIVCCCHAICPKDPLMDKQQFCECALVQHRVARQIGLFLVEGLASMHSLAHVYPGCNGVLVAGLALTGELISLLTSLSYRQSDKRNLAKEL